MHLKVLYLKKQLEAAKYYHRLRPGDIRKRRLTIPEKTSRSCPVTERLWSGERPE